MTAHYEIEYTLLDGHIERWGERRGYALDRRGSAYQFATIDEAEWVARNLQAHGIYDLPATIVDVSTGIYMRTVGAPRCAHCGERQPLAKGVCMACWGLT